MKSLAAIFFVLSCSSASAIAQGVPLFGCKGHIVDESNGHESQFVAMVVKRSASQFIVMDPRGGASITSPVMYSDSVTGGKVGSDGEAIYRANYIPGKDIFEIFSSEYSVKVECKRK